MLQAPQYLAHTKSKQKLQFEKKNYFQINKKSKHVPFPLVQRLQFKRHTHSHTLCLYPSIESALAQKEVTTTMTTTTTKGQFAIEKYKSVTTNIKQYVAQVSSIYAFKRKVWFTQKNQMTFNDWQQIGGEREKKGSVWVWANYSRTRLCIVCSLCTCLAFNEN